MAELRKLVQGVCFLVTFVLAGVGVIALAVWRWRWRRWEVLVEAVVWKVP